MGRSSSDCAPAREGADSAAVVKEAPRSVEIASSGIRDDHQAAEYLSALIGDVMTDRVSVRIANTGVNAMGKLLKLVEMRQKYGQPENARSLDLVGGGTRKPTRREQLMRELEELDASEKVVGETVGVAR